MAIADDASYYTERERAERCLAANAKDEAARAAHLAMAAAYRRRAFAARKGSQQTSAPPQPASVGNTSTLRPAGRPH